MNLYKYRYSHAATFLKQQDSPSALTNFRGEIYEAAFYEHLVIVSATDARAGMRPICKGIYTPKVNTHVRHGFYCDTNGQCIYNSHGHSVAEFDAIIICDKSLCFYECTLTQKPENLRKLKNKALRKFLLLQQMFPEYTVTCKIVSDNNFTLRPFENIEGFSTQLFGFPAVDPLDVATNLSPQSVAPSHRMRSANSLNKIARTYDCLANFKALSRKLFKQPMLSLIKDEIFAPACMVQRLCWGKISAEQLEGRLGKIEAEFVFLLINFENINVPRIRYYFFDSLFCVIYEAGNPPKKLGSEKVSRLELASVREHAPLRVVCELLALEEELAAWTAAV